MKVKALLKIDLDSDRGVFLKALRPETRKPITRRSSVEIREIDGGIALEFEASDLGALRSAISAYARWLLGISESLKAMNESLRGK